MKKNSFNEGIYVSKEEAMAFEPRGYKDVSCVVRSCYDSKTIEIWKSRNAAISFYRIGAASCDGSERDRYLLIADYLSAGCRDVCDNIDKMTRDMLDVLVSNNPTFKDLYEPDYAYADKHYKPVKFEEESDACSVEPIVDAE